VVRVGVANVLDTSPASAARIELDHLIGIALQSGELVGVCGVRTY
jgi:hypothetical protein